MLRLIKLYRILARHDVLYLLQRTNPPAWAHYFLRKRRKKHALKDGKRLASALQEMGPTFIKLGQVLATRADLVGEEIANDLTHLQDDLPQFSFKKVQEIFQEEFQQPLHNLFQSFDEHAVAAASIAQVHKAITTDGRTVAVKIMRPDIEENFRRDTQLFKKLIQFIDKRQPKLRRMRLKEMMQVFEQTVTTEMDLRMEAAACSELADNMKKHEASYRDSLYIPAIDWERTGQRVLTQEWVNGISLSQISALEKAGHNRTELLSKLANIFFLQVLRDGFFHADMHPGNVFVLQDGRIALIDFGIMGRLDKRMRYFMADTFHGFLVGDYKRVAEVHFREDIVPATQSVELFTQACRAIGQPLLDKPLSDVSLGRLLAQLIAVSDQFQMVLQPQLLLLQKSMVVTEGVGRLLNPSVNMWELSRALIEEWMRKNRSPQAQLREQAMETLEALTRLPKVVRQLEVLLEEKVSIMHPK